MLKNNSPRALCAMLNRLLIADRNEGLALDNAALIVQGAERRDWLLQQVLRRGVFERDLSRAIVALGGVPAKAPSYSARLGNAARRLRSLLTGPNEGDVYAACARATEKTSNAYARALRSTLPPDVRFGIEREFSEIEWDRRELGRLRFGARPAASPSERARSNPAAAPPARLPLDRSDERALETWSDEGGASS